MIFLKKILKKNFFLYDLYAKLKLMILHKKIGVLFYNTKKDLNDNFNILSKIADSKFNYNMIESLFNYKFKEIIFEEIKKKFKNEKIRLLEIGTFDAKFTNWLSNLFPRGEIITIDIDHKSKDFIILEKSSSFAKEILLKNREKNLKRENIKFIQMNSVDLMKKFSQESFDIIFVDGYHKDPIVSEDIKNSYALIKKNGYVVVDDLSYSSHMNSSLDGMNAFKKLKNTKSELLLKHVRPHNYFFKSYVGFYQKRN